MTIKNYPNHNPAFVLNFKSGKIDPRVTVQRSDSRNYYGEAGIMVSASVDMPRVEYHPTTGECLGLLVEGRVTNMFLNSDVGVTQTVTLVSGYYHSITWEGDGNITPTPVSGEVYDGVCFDGRKIKVFRPSSDTVTLVVSGDVRRVMLEEKTHSSRYVRTTGSQTSTSFEIVKISVGDVLPSGGDFCYIATFSMTTPPRGRWNRAYLQLRQNNTSNNYSQIYGDRSNGPNGSVIPSHFCYAAQQGGEGIVSTGYGLNINVSERQRFRMGFSFKYDPAEAHNAVNGDLFGGLKGTITSTFNNFTELHIGSDQSGTQGCFGGHLEEVIFYNRHLTRQELAAITTIS